MRKRTIIIISIVSTILSVIWIVLTYFGIIRYLTLCMPISNETYVRNYSKLPKSDAKRVVVSFTVTPETVNKIKPMINSILDQTIKVNSIFVVIPSDKKYDLPKYITDVAIPIPSGKDYGDGTKLIPILLREKECDTTIITLDSNVVYGQDFLYTLIDESMKNPSSVIVDKKGNAMLVKPELFGCEAIDREKENFDTSWFLSKTKSTKTIDYYENYRIIGM
jgi:hypothetical protein